MIAEWHAKDVVGEVNSKQLVDSICRTDFLLISICEAQYLQEQMK